MKIKKLESLIKNDIEEIFEKILLKYNYIFPISSKSRSGAEISDYLEDEFVLYLKENPHKRIYNGLGSPKGASKNPYDFCFCYKCKEIGFDDLIWGDIKATKTSYKDSNPDLGTPEKLIKFILNGHFYILFVFLEYNSVEGDKTKFKAFEDGKYVHCQFLKDIHHSVRINPKPQFQVNIKEEEEYRSIDEFVELFYKKYQESIERNIIKQQKKKEELEERFLEIKEKLKLYKGNNL